MNTRFLIALTAFVLCCLAYCQLAGHHTRATNLAQRQLPRTQRSLQPAPLPEGVHKMLGNRPVFYGPQLDAAQLEQFLADYPIEHVVDLAHEAAAQAILPDSTEAAICTGFDLFPTQYHALNIEGRGGRLNGPALATIDSLIDTYTPIYIHCRTGGTRAKVPIARAYARDGYRFNTIVDLLQWHEVVRAAAYDKYTSNVWAYAEQFNHPVKHTK